MTSREGGEALCVVSNFGGSGHTTAAIATNGAGAVVLDANSSGAGISGYFASGLLQRVPLFPVRFPAAPFTRAQRRLWASAIRAKPSGVLGGFARVKLAAALSWF